MGKLPLSLKLSDAIKFQFNRNWLPAVFGIAFGVYLSNISFNTLIINIVPVLLAVEAVVIFITCNATSTYLTRNGISYINWRGMWILCAWESPMEISQSPRPGFYSIKDVEKNKVISINIVVFSYPEVAKFINENAPLGHKIRDMVVNGS